MRLWDPRFEKIVASLAPKAQETVKTPCVSQNALQPQRLVAQFDVPVREIDKVFPEIVLGRRKRNLDKRPPLRPLRFANQAHVRFAREPVTLAGIAWDAGANHIFPSRCSPAVAGHNVIEIQFAAIEHIAAVLAGILVPLKHIMTGEFHFLFRESIKHKQDNHPRDPDLERNSRNYFMIRRVGRQIAPTFEIVRREVVRVV
jgi:hypothetical protein